MKTAASSKYFVTADKVADEDGISNIYYVITDVNNAATVTLIGTVDAVVSDLHDTNFFGE